MQLDACCLLRSSPTCGFFVCACACRSNRQLPVFIAYSEWFKPKYVLMENVQVGLGAVCVYG